MWNSWLMYTLAHSLACVSWSSFPITINYRKYTVGCFIRILANKPRTFWGVYPSRLAPKLFISILGISHTQAHDHHV